MVELLPSVIMRAPINGYSKKLLLSALRDQRLLKKISLSESDVRRILRAVSEDSPTAEAAALSVCQKLYHIISQTSSELEVSLLSSEK